MALPRGALTVLLEVKKCEVLATQSIIIQLINLYIHLLAVYLSTNLSFLPILIFIIESIYTDSLGTHWATLPSFIDFSF